MSDQASLFEQPAPAAPSGAGARPRRLGRATARATDPQPSHDAAEVASEHVSEQCLTVLAALTRIEAHGGHGATSHEVVMHLAYTGRAPQQNVVARRFTDLARAGLVVDTGDRRAGGGERPVPATVWATTPVGRERVAA